MTAQSCNDFRRECERELGATMTYAGKAGVTLKGEPWQEAPDYTAEHIANLAEPWASAYANQPDNATA